jgi:3-methylfumaryl-CoA hydratase
MPLKFIDELIILYMNSKIDQEICSLAVVHKVAAMLNIEQGGLTEGAQLPRGWQFPLLAARTKRTALRSDGFPGFGVPMPEHDFPRLLLGARTVRFAGDIPIGAAVERTSSLQSMSHKETTTGAMCVATILHELRLAGDKQSANSLVHETQTYLLLPARVGCYTAGAAGDPRVMTGDFVRVVVPDETLLFQYSALGFNSHKIHLDKEHARQVEGFPDLVVNGGLTTLLLTEFLRLEIGVSPRQIKVRYLVPLFCGCAITLTAAQAGEVWHLKAFDNNANLAVDMEVTAYEF